MNQSFKGFGLWRVGGCYPVKFSYAADKQEAIRALKPKHGDRVTRCYLYGYVPVALQGRKPKDGAVTVAVDSLPSQRPPRALAIPPAGTPAPRRRPLPSRR
jgi:hypothetical protein